jgi:DNA-binding PadR family transcriptional regulator
MQENGYLRSSVQRSGRQSRRVYRATPKVKKALAITKEKVSELFGELF